MSNKGLFLAKTSSDYLAASEIVNRKIPYFLAHRYWREKVNNRARTCSELRLKSYCFVWLTVADGPWPGIIRATADEAGVVGLCRGVDRLFCRHDGEPQRQRDDVILSLQALEVEELRYAQVGKAKGWIPAFAPGEAVRATHNGLWDGFEGEVIATVRGIVTVAIENITKEFEERDLVRVQGFRKSA